MKENNSQEILKDILLKMNYDLSKTLSEQSVPIPNRQGMPSDYLGSGGRFQLQFPEYDLKQQEKISNTVRVTPSEYTKKLTNEQYQEFLKERNRIVKLPPSFKATEYNKKYSEALSEFQNYDKKYDDYYSAEKTYLNQLEYITALYYPEKWTPNLKTPFTAHDGLLLVAVGVFAIPLLLAAAGASTVVVSGAFLGAQIVSTSADVADALLYLNEGNLEMAGLSAIFAVLPFVPNLARYSKELIESAVKKYSKGTALDKVESDIVTQLTKKETKEQITKAAEQEASKKLTPEIETAIIKGHSTIKTILKTGGKSVSKLSKTKTAEFLSVLAGFYLVGQGYTKAVEAYKKYNKGPFEIYQVLLKSGKISTSWEDLKFIFGSTGTKEDNEKLGAALLSGYTDKNSEDWLYNNPEFQTQTWKEKFLPNIIVRKKRESAYDNLKKNDNINDEDNKIIQQDVLTSEDGVTHSVDEYREINKKAKEENIINYQKDTAFLKYKGYIK